MCLCLCLCLYIGSVEAPLRIQISVCVASSLPPPDTQPPRYLSPPATEQQASREEGQKGKGGREEAEEEAEEAEEAEEEARQASSQKAPFRGIIPRSQTRMGGGLMSLAMAAPVEYSVAGKARAAPHASLEGWT